MYRNVEIPPIEATWDKRCDAALVVFKVELEEGTLAESTTIGSTGITART